jgi:hypothetical protein
MINQAIASAQLTFGPLPAVPSHTAENRGASEPPSRGGVCQARAQRKKVVKSGVGGSIALDSGLLMGDFLVTLDVVLGMLLNVLWSMDITSWESTFPRLVFGLRKRKYLLRLLRWLIRKPSFRFLMSHSISASVQKF